MKGAVKHFQVLVADGQPFGEVESVNAFFVKVRGMQPVSPKSLVLFEDGSKGFVEHISATHVDVLHLGTTPLMPGMGAVLQYRELVCKVGPKFLGRVVDVFGRPLDGKEPVEAEAAWPVFQKAPSLHERLQLNDQLPTGITIIDSVMPLVMGQRIAILGDSRSGKSTMATQLAINQRGTTRVVVYVLIGKRQTELDALISRLQATNAMDHVVIVATSIFDSLVANYMAPYVGCAMAEYFWQVVGLDTVVVYDDLTSHAMAHRQIGLLTGASPGRDSYPGDTFFIHATLLERAGRLKNGGKTLTALPLVLTPGGDISAFLPTNVMSITDGQWILDLDVFRDGLRPAMNIGLSVSRVGGRGHSQRQKELAARMMQLLAEYRQAQEFSHFGSELALEAQRSLQIGKHLQELLTQGPHETFSLIAQQLMIDVLLHAEGRVLDLKKLKETAESAASEVTHDEQFADVRDKLMSTVTLELKR